MSKTRIKQRCQNRQSPALSRDDHGSLGSRVFGCGDYDHELEDPGDRQDENEFGRRVQRERPESRQLFGHGACIGFKTRILNGIEVKPGATARADISLQIGYGCCEYVCRTAPRRGGRLSSTRRNRSPTTWVMRTTTTPTRESPEVVYADRKAWPCRSSRPIATASRKAGIHSRMARGITVPEEATESKAGIYKVTAGISRDGARAEHVSGDVVLDVTLRVRRHGRSRRM